MSYEPTNWKAGDTVTSAKLNKIEQGIASSGGVVMPTYTSSDMVTFTCDMTFAEIESAISEGKYVVARVIVAGEVDMYNYLPVATSYFGHINYSSTTTEAGEDVTCVSFVHNNKDEMNLFILNIPTPSSDADSGFDAH